MSAQPDSFLGAAANDADAQETREWLDALSAVVAAEGVDRAHFLVEQLIDVLEHDGACSLQALEDVLDKHPILRGEVSAPGESDSRRAPCDMSVQSDSDVK